MPYSELMIAPMRNQLKEIGLEELRTAEEVDAYLRRARETTALIVVNSVCGCSAGSMRPAVAAALRGDARPELTASVFAGQDVEATERVRARLEPYPPSSPAVALFRNGSLVFLLQRPDTQGRHPAQIAAELGAAFDEHCAEAPTGS